ncbi:hypothetical protein BJV77DRAFT_303728 [Russula vinacea]|nr:hypothetical protein BJV77DRAFT_303728 [Russula vinacea]
MSRARLIVSSCSRPTGWRRGSPSLLESNKITDSSTHGLERVEKAPPEAKQRFKDAAYQAKVEHSIKYPGYRFTPKPRGDRANAKPNVMNPRYCYEMRRLPDLSRKA